MPRFRRFQKKQRKISSQLSFTREKYKVKHLYRDEAIMDMEMNEKPFILFHDAKNDCLAILYKRDDGDYAMVAPVEDA